MTKKQLIQAIEHLPEDTELLMAIWGLKGDGYTYFNIRAPYEKIDIKPIATGGTAAVISRADHCRAHTMIENNDGTFRH